MYILQLNIYLIKNKFLHIIVKFNNLNFLVNFDILFLYLLC